MFRKILCILFIFCLICTVGCEHKKKTENEKKLNYNSEINIISKKCECCELHLIKGKNFNILINCAQKENIKKTVEFLKEENIEKIDYLIITDFSDDNLSGASIILRKLDVKNIIQPSYVPKNSKLYKAYNEALKFKNISPLFVTNDKTISVGDITLTFFGCDNTAYNNDSKNCSLVFKLTHYDVDFLFLGNIKEERMSQLIQKNIKANFIKLSSEIKNNKAFKAFIKKSNPTYCYISCSNYAPANSEVKNYLKGKNIQLYNSFENDYTFLSDGITINERNK